jgi:hypothetical protein
MVRNGWKVYSDPLFANQLNILVEKAEKMRVQSSETYHSEPATKLLATIEDLIYKQIPSNPEARQFAARLRPAFRSHQKTSRKSAGCEIIDACQLLPWERVDAKSFEQGFFAAFSRTGIAG